MRRATLAVVAALPALARALEPSAGQLIEPDNFNVTSGKSYFNAAACSGTLNVTWNILPVVSGAVTSGTIGIYASDTAPTKDTATGGYFCAETSSPSATPPVNAGQVTTTQATAAVQSLGLPGSKILQTVAFIAATASCDPADAALDQKTFYLCAHWTDANSVPHRGYAIGTFVVQVLKPNPPTNVTAAPGTGKLEISWTASAPGTGFVGADHYVAQATPVGGGTTLYSSTTTGTSAIVSGLENGQEYTFGVVAYSIGGNPSETATGAGTATPTASADFWDVYKDAGGVETGGCSPGAAGGLAILGAASLLALRRRKP